MNRLFLKEESRIYVPAKKKFKTTVCGISQSAGTTTVAVNLAFLLSKKIERCRCEGNKPMITLVEMERPVCGKETLYYFAGFDKKFKEKSFFDWFEYIEKGGTGGRKLNLHKGVNWVIHGACRGEGRIKESSYLLKGVPGDIIIADSPDISELNSFDLIIAVIDPLPGKVYAGIENVKKIKEYEKNGQNVIWILNCMNNHVHLKSLEKFLKMKSYITLPLLNREIMYECAYRGFFVTEFMEYSEDPLVKEYVKNMEILCDEFLILCKTD